MPPLPITARQTLTSAAGPQQCLAVVDHWLGAAWRVEHPDERTMSAWRGSRIAYRLLSSWAGASQLPIQATFQAAPARAGTALTVTMSSDEGRYMLTAPRAKTVYQARFAQLLADLADLGFTPAEPASPPQSH